MSPAAGRPGWRRRTDRPGRVAPLGPFLDPGRRAFEHPEQLGFHRRLTTLAEHRAALLGPTWRDMLSYETDWMNRDEIVAVTYEVVRQLNDHKYRAGLIDEGTHTTVAAHLSTAVRILAEVQALSTVPEPERHRRLRLLQAAAQSANAANLVGEDELKWQPHGHPAQPDVDPQRARCVPP